MSSFTFQHCLPTKAQRVAALFDGLQSNLATTLALYQSKLIWSFQIKRLSDEHLFAIDVVDESIIPPTLAMRIALNGHQLKSLDLAHQNESRRSFLNDVYLLTSRFQLLIDSLLKNRQELRPEFAREKMDDGLNCLNRFFTREEKLFLTSSQGCGTP